MITNGTLAAVTVIVVVGGLTAFLIWYFVFRNKKPVAGTTCSNVFPNTVYQYDENSNCIPVKCVSGDYTYSAVTGCAPKIKTNPIITTAKNPGSACANVFPNTLYEYDKNSNCVPARCISTDYTFISVDKGCAPRVDSVDLISVDQYITNYSLTSSANGCGFIKNLNYIQTAYPNIIGFGDNNNGGCGPKCSTNSYDVNCSKTVREGTIGYQYDGENSIYITSFQLGAINSANGDIFETTLNDTDGLTIYKWWGDTTKQTKPTHPEFSLPKIKQIVFDPSSVTLCVSNTTDWFKSQYFKAATYIPFIAKPQYISISINPTNGFIDFKYSDSTSAPANNILWTLNWDSYVSNYKTGYSDTYPETNTINEFLKKNLI